MWLIGIHLPSLSGKNVTPNFCPVPGFTRSSKLVGFGSDVCAADNKSLSDYKFISGKGFMAYG